VARTPRQRHNLAASVRRLAIDIAAARERKTRTLADELLGEREEQFQVEITGTAGALAWSTIELGFEHVYSEAIARRTSQLKVPQFHAGFELRQPRDRGVVLHAQVARWLYDGPHVGGVLVRLGAEDPYGPTPYRAVAHLTFQGYGVLRDDGDEED
jgi:hypothetical protein